MDRKNSDKISPETIMLHESLIRFAKGMISAWEKWLKEKKQN